MGIILTIIIMYITVIVITITLDSSDNCNRLVGLWAKILNIISTLFICMEIWIFFRALADLTRAGLSYPGLRQDRVWVQDGQVETVEKLIRMLMLVFGGYCNEVNVVCGFTTISL